MSNLEERLKQLAEVLDETQLKDEISKLERKAEKQKQRREQERANQEMQAKFEEVKQAILSVPDLDKLFNGGQMARIVIRKDENGYSVDLLKQSSKKSSGSRTGNGNGFAKKNGKATLVKQDGTIVERESSHALARELSVRTSGRKNMKEAFEKAGYEVEQNDGEFTVYEKETE